ncbi:MAG: hypothetical protein RL654_530 [Pseudomonadota bacterium]
MAALICPIMAAIRAAWVSMSASDCRLIGELWMRTASAVETGLLCILRVLVMCLRDVFRIHAEVALPGD